MGPENSDDTPGSGARFDSRSGLDDALTNRLRRRATDQGGKPDSREVVDEVIAGRLFDTLAGDSFKLRDGGKYDLLARDIGATWEDAMALLSKSGDAVPVSGDGESGFLKKNDGMPPCVKEFEYTKSRDSGGAVVGRFVQHHLYQQSVSLDETRDSEGLKSGLRVSLLRHVGDYFDRIYKLNVRDFIDVMPDLVDKLAAFLIQDGKFANREYMDDISGLIDFLTTLLKSHKDKLNFERVWAGYPDKKRERMTVGHTGSEKGSNILIYSVALQFVYRIVDDLKLKKPFDGPVGGM